MSSGEALKHYAEMMGCDWVVDEQIDKNTIYVYDSERYLKYEVRTPDGMSHYIIIDMFDNDEVVIKIKKVD